MILSSVPFEVHPHPMNRSSLFIALFRHSEILDSCIMILTEGSNGSYVGKAKIHIFRLILKTLCIHCGLAPFNIQRAVGSRTIMFLAQISWRMFPVDPQGVVQNSTVPSAT